MVKKESQSKSKKRKVVISVIAFIAFIAFAFVMRVYATGNIINNISDAVSPITNTKVVNPDGKSDIDGNDKKAVEEKMNASNTSSDQRTHYRVTVSPQYKVITVASSSEIRKLRGDEFRYSGKYLPSLSKGDSVLVAVYDQFGLSSLRTYSVKFKYEKEVILQKIATELYEVIDSFEVE